MSISDRFAEMKQIRDSLGCLAADPARIVMERFISPTEAIIAGRPTVLVGTNNYLGLTFDPAIIEAACGALRAEGSGTTGSRMANGSFSSHAALEDEFAAFYGMPSSMIFSTGYQTNLGLLMGLLRPGDKVVLDAHSHACLYDGCRISGADFFAFKHNDPDDLRKRLRRLVRDVPATADLLASTPRKIALQRPLGLPAPRYAHLPLAVDAAGRKLSKQTRAPATGAARAPQLWHRVLAFLGHPPPAQLRSAPLAETVDWALAQWRLERVPARPQLPAGAVEEPCASAHAAHAGPR